MVGLSRSPLPGFSRSAHIFYRRSDTFYPELFVGQGRHPASLVFIFELVEMSEQDNLFRQLQSISISHGTLLRPTSDAWAVFLMEEDGDNAATYRRPLKT